MTTHLLTFLAKREKPKSFLEFTFKQSSVERILKEWILPGNGNVQQKLTIN